MNPTSSPLASSADVASAYPPIVSVGSAAADTACAGPPAPTHPAPQPATAPQPTYRPDIHAPAAPQEVDVDPPAPGRTAALLAGVGGWGRTSRTLLTGLLLAAVYGLAVGCRLGGAALASHALLVPAAAVAVMGLGVPALYIVLALFDTPLSPLDVARASARAAAALGITLAGFAPGVALFVVTGSTGIGGALIAAAGLVLGGLLALVHFKHGLDAALSDASAAKRGTADFAFACFAAFSMVLAARVWISLPIFGGL